MKKINIVVEVCFKINEKQRLQTGYIRIRIHEKIQSKIKYNLLIVEIVNKTVFVLRCYFI